MARSIMYGGGGVPSFLGGSVDVYASLPVPISVHVGQVYFVEEGSGTEVEGVFQYPVGLYTPNVGNTAWVITPINVAVASNSYVNVDVTDWASFFAFGITITAGDKLTFNGYTYVNLTGNWSTTPPDLDETNWGSYIDIAPRSLTAYKKGRISFDELCGCHVSDTGYTDVRNSIGRETHREVWNDTGLPINNGDPVSVVTGLVTTDLPHVIPCDSSDVLNIAAFAGVATMDIPHGESGIVTIFGNVHDYNTGSLDLGFIYADDAGGYTQVRPVYPNRRLIIGGVLKLGIDGIINVNPVNFPRAIYSKSYSFTSQGIGAGTYDLAGFYKWSTTSATRDNTTPSILYGVVGKTYAAHAGIVPNGPGTVVGTGQVGLRVTGIEDMETGIQMAGQTAIITEDITTLTANVMAETSEKFSGQVTFELYVVSGSPTSYSLTFNYGYSKYEDFGNNDFTIIGLEAVWLASATDPAFNVKIRHHKATGWTYTASGFIPGDGNIAERLVDQSLAPDVVNNLYGTWKRTNLLTFVEGSGPEGLIIEVVTTANNTIQTMNLHIDAVSEEL